VTIDYATTTDTFQTSLEHSYQLLTKTGGLQNLRSKAWEKFLESGLPSRQNEHYRDISLHKLYSQAYELAKKTTISPRDIDPHILPECSQSVLVFINGYFSTDLSRIDQIPAQVIIASLDKAMSTYAGFITHQWNKTLKDVCDPFAALNGALHADGLFLYLPPKTLVGCQIQFLNIIDESSTPTLVVPRIQVYAGSNTKSSFISTKASLSPRHCLNMMVDISLEECSSVTYTQIEDHALMDAWHFDSMHATLKRDASLKTIAVTKGAQTARYDYHVALIGENAEANLNGIWMLSEKREAHTRVLIDHQAPNCRSMQLFKGVLNDCGRSSFEGKIIVQKPAQKTEAFQLNQNLLLNVGAHADSRPNLEIFADDVKASHGSTIGQLDEEHIIYMKMRGFDENTAKNLLVNGFCQEITDMISIPSFHQKKKQLDH